MFFLLASLEIMRVLVSTIADCWEVVAVSLDFVLCLFSSFHAFSAAVLFLFSQFRLKGLLLVNGLYISCDFAEWR